MCVYIYIYPYITTFFPGLKGFPWSLRCVFPASPEAHQGPVAQRAEALVALHAHGLVEDVAFQDEATQPRGDESMAIVHDL